MTANAQRRIMLMASAALTLLGADVLVRGMRAELTAYTVADYIRKPSVIANGPMPRIILMGSSRAKYALVPDEFERATGRSAYNLGIAGSKVVEWITLSRALFKVDRPDLVVVGINASEVRLDYSPTDAARNLFTLDDLFESCAHEGVSTSVIGAYLQSAAGPLCEVYHHRYELRMWAQERLRGVLPKHAQQARELRERVATPEPPNGYTHPWAQGEQLRSVEERLLNNVATVEAASVPLFSCDSPSMSRLAQFLNELQTGGIRTIVVYIPNCPRTEARWSDIEPHAINVIASVCRETGVAFVPCSPEEVPRTNRDFIEEVHVGLPLARTISRRAARQILAMGLLPIESRHIVTKINDVQD